MRHLTIAALAAAIIAALLIPAGASAQSDATTASNLGRGCQPANSPRCQQSDRIRERFQERRDAQNGVTDACRAAVDKYVLAKSALSRSKSAVGPWKTALKNAKTKKAKKKYAKGLKKARARYKKAKKVNLAGFRTSADQACASARIKPTY